MFLQNRLPFSRSLDCIVLLPLTGIRPLLSHRTGRKQVVVSSALAYHQDVSASEIARSTDFGVYRGRVCDRRLIDLRQDPTMENEVQDLMHHRLGPKNHKKNIKDKRGRARARQRQGRWSVFRIPDHRVRRKIDRRMPIGRKLLQNIVVKMLVHV
jgi:hypothetical protein